MKRKMLVYMELVRAYMELVRADKELVQDRRGHWWAHKAMAWASHIVAHMT